MLRTHGRERDVHARVAQRLIAERLLPVLDVGGGWIGLDSSQTMLARAPEPAVCGDATDLPYADGELAAVSLLYVLYYLDEPDRALAEAYRVLRPGGVVVVAVPSRHDSPELTHLIERPPLTFDAELAPAVLAAHFDAVEVERWDAPLIDLPDPAAVRDYLVGKGVPRARAQRGAETVTTPLSVTKRGALLFSRRR